MVYPLCAPTLCAPLFKLKHFAMAINSVTKLDHSILLI